MHRLHGVDGYRATVAAEFADEANAPRVVYSRAHVLARTPTPDPKLRDSPEPKIVTPLRRAEFESRGFFFTDPLFSREEIAVVRAACEAAYLDDVAREAPALARRVRPFLPAVHRRSGKVADFLRHRVFRSLARDLIGADVDQAWNQACIKLPDADGLTEFPYHQDSRFAALDRPDPGFACFLALAPLDIENGTLHFVAGAHRTELAHAWNPTLNWWQCDVTGFEVVPGVLEPGAMVVYHPGTPHGSPANGTSRPREAMLASFAPPGIRLRETGELFGDQRPLLRGGQLASAPE